MLLGCVIAFLIVLASVLWLIFRQRRGDLQQMASIHWRVQKAHRFADGWRPTLWDETDPTVTEEQKVEAMMAYALGKPIPPSGREARGSARSRKERCR